MTLSEMRQILDERGIQLTKSLGQSFLHDANQLRRIIEAADLRSTDRVLEIGPGLGPLTEVLARDAGEVLAIEKDRRLVKFLEARFARPCSSLRLIHADALEYLREKNGDWSDWKLVSNLPYSVASTILVELAQSGFPPRLMVVTLQLEVAQRLIAQAGTENYGILSLLMQLQYEPRGLFKIPASCFFPKPDVDSACVTLARRPQSLLEENQRVLFVEIVKHAFSQRRKMMLKLLKAKWPEDRMRTAFEQLDLSPQTRAETVSLEQFVRLTRALSST